MAGWLAGLGRGLESIGRTTIPQYFDAQQRRQQLEQQAIELALRAEAEQRQREELGELRKEREHDRAFQVLQNLAPGPMDAGAATALFQGGAAPLRNIFTAPIPEDTLASTATTGYAGLPSAPGLDPQAFADRSAVEGETLQTTTPARRKGDVEFLGTQSARDRLAQARLMQDMQKATMLEKGRESRSVRQQTGLDRRFDAGLAVREKWQGIQAALGQQRLQAQATGDQIRLGQLDYLVQRANELQRAEEAEQNIRRADLFTDPARLPPPYVPQPITINLGDRPEPPQQQKPAPPPAPTGDLSSDPKWLQLKDPQAIMGAVQQLGGGEAGLQKLIDHVTARPDQYGPYQQPYLQRLQTLKGLLAR